MKYLFEGIGPHLKIATLILLLACSLGVVFLPFALFSCLSQPCGPVLWTHFYRFALIFDPFAFGAMIAGYFSLLFGGRNQTAVWFLVIYVGAQTGFTTFLLISWHTFGPFAFRPFSLQAMTIFVSLVSVVIAAILVVAIRYSGVQSNDPYIA